MVEKVIFSLFSFVGSESRKIFASLFGASQAEKSIASLFGASQAEKSKFASLFGAFQARKASFKTFSEPFGVRELVLVAFSEPFEVLMRGKIVCSKIFQQENFFKVFISFSQCGKQEARPETFFKSVGLQKVFLFLFLQKENFSKVGCLLAQFFRRSKIVSNFYLINYCSLMLLYYLMCIAERMLGEWLWFGVPREGAHTITVMF